MQEAREMSVREQIEWYLDQMNDKMLKRVLLCVFRIFLGDMK